MLRLSKSRPAHELLPLVQSLHQRDELTLRQYRIWYLANFTNQSLFAITQTLADEGFRNPRGRAVSLATVKADLAKARRIIDLADLKLEEETGGAIQFNIAISHGARLGITPDWTAIDAHKRLGIGIQTERLKLAA